MEVPLPNSFHASHDPPNFRPVHWDPVIIQNLGGDATTLDSDVADENTMNLRHSKFNSFDSDSSEGEGEVYRRQNISVSISNNGF
jgi:hypothetical protein